MKTFAIGDPQAPFATFLAILERHGLLTARADDPRARLRDDVRLISMGDHFDWGRPAERARAAADAMRLVAWLADHDADQAVMIAGNHDLARVGELWGVDDPAFARAQALADRAYLHDDREAEAQFHREFPRFTTAEVVARDLSTFREEQARVVAELLRTRRLRLAHVQEGALFVHAGITTHELDVVGVAHDAPADVIARALNGALERATDVHLAKGGAFAIPGLHDPGNGQVEGLGMLYHRPSRGLDDDEKVELARTPPRRRFEPHRIPRGLVQVIGHIRDSKCRRLMKDIADDAATTDGVLRSLVVDDAGLRYRHGLQVSGAGAGAVWFLDGGMSSCAVDAYELLDVDARAAAVPLTHR